MFVNKAATLLTGFDAAHLIGRSIFDFLPTGAQTEAMRRRDQLLSGELAETSDEYQVALPGGNGPWLQVTSVRIEWEGRPATLNLGSDVTARHNAEAVLRESLHEKEGLLKEIHHRVKNNLQVVTSLLRLEAGRSKVEATRTALQEMQGRIRSMALLHEMLYRSANFADVDLADYVRQLATQLFRALNTRFGAIRLHLELDSISLGIDQAIPCGLIVNELLTNSLKHAFPDSREGEIRIRLSRTQTRQVQLRVSDNGVGLPADLAALQGRSLGLQLVTDLVRQLHGTLELSAPGPGAAFTITFDHAEPPPPGNGSPAELRGH
jgi:PAS domain S-box-containing protein